MQLELEGSCLQHNLKHRTLQYGYTTLLMTFAEIKICLHPKLSIIHCSVKFRSRVESIL